MVMFANASLCIATTMTTRTTKKTKATKATRKMSRRRCSRLGTNEETTL